MDSYEVELLVDAYYNDYQKEWEQTRWLGYVNALSNGAKLKSPKDLIKFKWEEPDISEIDNRTQEEIQKTQEMLIQAVNKESSI